MVSETNSQDMSQGTSILETVRQNPGLTYREVAAMLHTKAALVGKQARQAGIHRYKPRRLASQGVASVLDGPPLPLEIASARTKKTLALLEQQLASREVFFEADGEIVVVHGVADVPLQAHYLDWLRFLQNCGAARLRKFIDEHWPRVGRLRRAAGGLHEAPE